MDRRKVLKGSDSLKIFSELSVLNDELSSAVKSHYDRNLPFAEHVFDRFDRARKLGWGEGSSVYDSSYIYGKVLVGRNCWIGPFTIIDGSGGLVIGERCTISAGVHIYSHDNVHQTLSDGRIPIVKEPVEIGSFTYIGPHSIIAKGVKIGHHAVIACNSFVNSEVPELSIVAGNPAKIIGKVILSDADIQFEYFK